MTLRVRAVCPRSKEVPHDEVFGATIDAGHWVWSSVRALEEVWPTVDAWLSIEIAVANRPAQIGATPYADSDAGFFVESA